ncbi:hypothetical protein HNQ69_000145 [Bartonella callosciuri]|uniref:Uncharacterized protein n=1 Tax=Bartonella callosciuri TaxID=686223 RepID=A0A840NPL6_9HYPH|nr:hypothetical protein [Bartonella callosciuri]
MIKFGEIGYSLDYFRLKQAIIKKETDQNGVSKSINWQGTREFHDCDFFAPSLFQKGL